MKRISFLSTVLTVLLFSGLTYAINFDVSIDPTNKFNHPDYDNQEFYKANKSVFIDLKMQNNDIANPPSTVDPDSLMDWCGWSMTLRIYGTRGGVEIDDGSFPVTWVNAGGGYPNPAIVRMNGWESPSVIWTSKNAWILASWDGILPDSINQTTIGCIGDPPAHPGGWVPYGWDEDPPWSGEWVSNYPSTEGQFPGDQDLQTRVEFHFIVPLSGSDTGSVCIDQSNWNDPGYDWLFSPAQNFGGPYCFPFATVPDLIVDKDYLFFQAYANGDYPERQTITLQNGGDLEFLNWSANWDSNWLNVLPSSGSIGSGPVEIEAVIIRTAMEPGIYEDTIDIVAPDAGNSPARIAIEYELLGPPPTIELSQTSFIFNAVANTSNPPDQILTISNSSYGDLNWSVSNGEDWLSLDPLSGVNTGDVTLSVDITGLPYGIYYDTIVVTDPLATNDPQRAYVQLEVSSDLPVIEIDSTFLFIIAYEDYPPDRHINITNAGAGTMNYYVVENSQRIINMFPTSGSVPQEVTFQFKTMGPPGYDFFDTVWVYSDEAINSPQFVEFQFHYTNDPAIIGVDKTSFTTQFYECGQGSDWPGQPPVSLHISDGGHEPFTFDITHEAEWLSLELFTYNAPVTIFLNYEFRGLAPGIYTDTLSISAINAINSPVKIPVTMTIMESVEVPELDMPVTEFYFAPQIDKPATRQLVWINNKNPGCMDWEIINDIPWFYDELDSRYEYPWLAKFYASGYGLSMGHYEGTFQMESNSASNTPIDINVIMDVWKLRCDNNYDGILNIIDIVYAINYIYKHGPEPQPVLEVGDCDCDDKINILDITALINYIYKYPDPLCGNPY